MNFLRIKQAQCALADGRLDEAHDLLKLDAVRSHRHGQKLATKLVKAFVKRGEAHLKEGRLHEALMDCEKAGSLGGHNTEVAELSQRVVQKMDEKRHDSEHRNLMLGAARQHAQEGFLSQGLAMLGKLNGDSTGVERVRQEFDLHRAKAQAAIERGEAALNREDWAAAGHHLAEARRLRPYDSQVESLSGRLTRQAVKRIREALDRGRVDTAESLLRAVSPAAGDDLAITELREAVAHVGRASAALTHGDARHAAQYLRKAKALLPGAKWINETINQADAIVSSRDALAAGPLGLISDGYASAAQAVPALRNTGTQDSGPVTPIVYHNGQRHASTGSPRLLTNPFLIQVDGCGAALASCNDRVTIGPVSSTERPDLGLVADPGVPTVTVQRIEEDYFLRSPRPIKVNGRTTSDTLLNDGDKIELSSRCRLRFRVPHAASTTAVIELTGARMVRGDIKRIVLLSNQLVMGAGSACHVRADEAEEPIILCLRDGQLTCRASQTVKVGGQTCDAVSGVPMDSPVCVGPVTFRVMQA